MTEPNEEINEELSTDELKSVSGGFGLTQPHYFTGSNPQGSGSGKTKADWERDNKRHDVVADENGKPCTGLVT